jgi:DNA-binding LacI/PurR family transcriptional regulator
VRGKVRPQRVPKRRAEVVLLRNARVKPDLTSLFPLMDALRQKLHRIGFDLVIADAMMQGAKRLDTTLSEIEAEHRPSFYLLYSVPTDVHRWFQKTNVPTLILGSRMPDVRLPAVDLDPVATVAHAVDHLFRRGHRRIGLLLTSASGVGDLRIEQQFYTDCKRHAADGMRGVMETAHARPAAVKAAIRRFFGRAQPPTAIIAADLELVIGTYAVLSEMGLAIPRQVSVLSAGYWPILDYLSPLPSCYKASWDRLSNHTIRVIGNYLRLGVWPNTFYKLLPTLREGQSVRTLS